MTWTVDLFLRLVVLDISYPASILSTMVSLPFDVIHILLDFATVGDLVNLCSTCKPLHVHLVNDSLWIRLCAPYGLKDFTHFGSVSPFNVYTKLLHPYGPILGLWANDHPFRGNVLEFRLFAGNENVQAGIIGEVWSCATHVDRDPTPPSYIQVLQITFEPEPKETVGDADSAAVRVSCYCNPSDPATRHPATIYVSASTHTRHRLEFYLQTVDLPEFPTSNAPWYDDAAPRLPRLPARPDSPLDQSLIIKIFPAARLPLIWAAPSAIRKPPAMSICCSQQTQDAECPCSALHAPPIPFKSLDDRPPRYYPLRRAIVRGVDPRSPSWALQTMDGLWYGSYGLHGTEILYLHTFADADGCRLVATKVTGDAHVPRGEVSWALGVLDEGTGTGYGLGVGAGNVAAVRAHWTMSLHVASIVAGPAVLSPARMLRGHGLVGAQGFK